MFKRLIAVALAGIVMLQPVAVLADSPANLIANPSVEAATSGNPDGWQSNMWGVNAGKLGYVTTEGRTGTGSLRASFTEYTDGDAKWFFTPITTTAGKTYTYTDYYKSDVATRVVAAFIDGAGTHSYLDLSINVPASPDAWSLFTSPSATFTVPAGTVQMTVYHLLDKVGTLNLDDVSLVEVAPSVPVGTTTAYITNGSLETANPANATLPANWTPASWGANTPAFEWVANGHTGDKSVKVTVSNYTDGDAKWTFDPIATGTGAWQLQRGKQYRFSAWYKTNTIPNAVVHFVRDDNTHAYYGMPNPQPGANAATTWQNYADTFTVPVDVKTVDVFFYINGNGWVQTDDYNITDYTPEGFTRPLVSLTFDDGHEENVANALPLMNSYGFKSTQCYMTGEAWTEPGHSTLEGNPAGQQGVLDFFNAGHEICSHTVTHRDLRTLNDDDLRYELQHSKEVLEGIIGQPILNIATPYGGYDARVNTFIDDYYQSHRTVDEGYNSKDNFEIYRLRVQNVQNTTTIAEFQSWLDHAAATNTWLILVYHRVADDAGQFDSYPYQFAEQLEAIKNSGLTVKTYQDALTEVKAQMGGTTPTPTPKPGDVNGDNTVDELDLSLVLSNWNRTGATRAQGDVNNDGTVDELDLSLVLTKWSN